MQGATQRRTSKAVRESPLSSELPPLLTQPVPTATVKRRKCGTSPFDHHWLNLDCCGLFCAVLTYGLHVYGCYAVCWLLIPPWMSTMEGEVRHLSLAGRFHMFGFVSIAAMAILSHFKAMTTDPGAVPPDAKPLPDPQDLEKGETTGESAAHKGKRLCRRCHAFKPPRAHHCSVCNRCIIKMDHHCPWVNNCVGIGNHKYFLLFVFYTCLSCLYSMSLVVSRFVICMHMHAPRGTPHAHCLDRPTHLLSILGLVCEAILFGLFTCCMMVDQWDVVASNMTHIDRLKGEVIAQLERVPGVTEVFGHGRRGFRLDWLSPFAQVCFPPSLRDEIMGYCRPCMDRHRRNDKRDEEAEQPSTQGRAPSSRGMVTSVTEIV